MSAPAPPPAPDAVSPDDHQVHDRTYRRAGLFVKPFVRTWYGVRVRGTEHVPATGGVILVSNHRSNADPPLVSLITPRPVRFLAKSELFAGPLGRALRAIGQLPLRRGASDRAALRAAAEVVGRGDILCLFPEGTRGTGRFDQLHPGAAYLIMRTGVPVVPVAVLGSERVRRRWWLPGSSQVRLVAGPPLDLPAPGVGKQARQEALEGIRLQLRGFVAAQEGWDPSYGPHPETAHRPPRRGRGDADD